MRNKGKAKGKGKARGARSLPRSSSSRLTAQEVNSALASLGERSGSSAHSLVEALGKNDKHENQSEVKNLLLKAVKMGKIRHSARNEYVLKVVLRPQVLRKKRTSRSHSRGRRHRSSKSPHRGTHHCRLSRRQRRQSRRKGQQVGRKRKGGRVGHERF